MSQMMSVPTNLNLDVRVCGNLVLSPQRWRFLFGFLCGIDLDFLANPHSESAVPMTFCRCKFWSRALCGCWSWLVVCHLFPNK